MTNLGPATAGAKFREALKQERPLQVVGAICANHALMAKRAGYRAIYANDSWKVFAAPGCAVVTDRKPAG